MTRTLTTEQLSQIKADIASRKAMPEFGKSIEGNIERLRVIGATRSHFSTETVEMLVQALEEKSRALADAERERDDWIEHSRKMEHRAIEAEGKLANREVQPVGFRYRHKDTVSWLYNDWRWPDSVEAEQCQIEWLYTAQPAPDSAQPVLYASEETLAYAKEGEKSLVTWSEPMGDAVIPLFTAPPAPAVQKDVEAVVGLLESGEWAEHCTNTELGQRLESAVTALMTNAPPAPAVPICFIDAIDDMENVMAWILRLPVPTEGATAKAGRLKNSIDACRAAMLAQPVSQGYKLPDGWKLVPVEPTEEMLRAANRNGDAYSVNAYRAMLAAAPEGGNG